MRRALIIAGVALVISGIFFALQGAGIIPWPAESFMVGQRAWIERGSGLALAGLVLIFMARLVR